MIEHIIKKAEIVGMDNREIEKQLFIDSKVNNRNQKITNSSGVEFTVDEYKRMLREQLEETRGILPRQGELLPEKESIPCGYSWRGRKLNCVSKEKYY